MPTDTEPASPAAGAAPGQAVRIPRAPSRMVMIAMVAIAVLWGLILAGMVWFSANPVTLNRRQMRRADAVVTATVTDAVRGTVKIDQVWFQKPLTKLKPTESVTVKRLRNSGGAAGGTYIIALTKNGAGAFRVTGAHDNDESPLIYPASESANEQMKAIAANR